MVYLLHFERAVSGTARHYLGYCRNDRLDKRLAEHRRGGCGMTRRAARLGISWELARTWPGDRKTEAQLKRAGKFKFKDHCPICQDLERKELP